MGDVILKQIRSGKNYRPGHHPIPAVQSISNPNEELAMQVRSSIQSGPGSFI